MIPLKKNNKIKLMASYINPLFKLCEGSETGRSAPHYGTAIWETPSASNQTTVCRKSLNSLNCALRSYNLSIITRIPNAFSIVVTAASDWNAAIILTLTKSIISI
ncbi:hypothetical protein X975_05977, partial [Stegodyphus mimosarum]